ncbi:sialidase family protein, partial [Brachyspira catarrhinii]
TNEDGKVFPAWYLTEEQQQQPYSQGPTIVFDSRGGTTDPQIYHIPAIIVADNGNIIALGDNRHKTGRDVGSKTGPIDIVYKISKDGGKTWSDEKTIPPASINDDMTGINNKGDVSVFKCLSGKLVALAVSGGGYINGANAATPSRMVMSKSLDNGENWSLWKEVGQDTVFKRMKEKNIVRGFATSGRGTTLKSGRLATCMVGQENGKGIVAYFLYSDDEGETWNLHPTINTAKHSSYSLSEPKIVGELDDGSLLMTVRNGDSKAGQQGQPRMYGYSTDGGLTWGTFDNPTSGVLGHWANMLCGNVDSEGIIWTRESEHDKTRILHLLTGPNFRRGMSFYISENGGRRFTKKLQVLDTTTHAANKYTAGYNSIDVCGDGTIVTLAEEYNESNTKVGDSDYDLV